jgi:hypothetical protein
MKVVRLEHSTEGKEKKETGRSYRQTGLLARASGEIFLYDTDSQNPSHSRQDPEALGSN